MVWWVNNGAITQHLLLQAVNIFGRCSDSIFFWMKGQSSKAWYRDPSDTQVSSLLPCSPPGVLLSPWSCTRTWLGVLLYLCLFPTTSEGCSKWRMLSMEMDPENISLPLATCEMEPVLLVYLIRILTCHIQVNQKGLGFIFVLGMNDRISGPEVKKMDFKN